MEQAFAEIIKFLQSVVDKYGPTGFMMVSMVCILAWTVYQNLKNNQRCEERLQTIGTEYRESMQHITENMGNALHEISTSVNEHSAHVVFMIESIHSITESHSSDHQEMIGIIRRLPCTTH